MKVPMIIERGCIVNTGWRFTLFGERSSNVESGLVGRLLCLVGLHKRVYMMPMFGARAPWKLSDCYRGCGRPGRYIT